MPTPSPDKRTQYSIWYFVAVLLFLFLLPDWLSSQPQTIRYSEFRALALAGELQEVTVATEEVKASVRADQLSPYLSSEEVSRLRPSGDDTVRIRAIRVEDPDLVQVLEEAGVSYTGVRENTWLTSMLSWLLPLAVLVLVWSFLLRRMSGMGGGGSGSMMSIGKSKAKIYMEKDTRVTFDDVAGVDEAKAELQEVVDFLRDPDKYSRLGAHIPKGVLLVGPPGTGKTLMARAVAGQASVPFLSISGSEFVEMFVGVGAARVRDLFNQARGMAPAIIFIDELDALGRARGANPMMNNDEKEQTLNQLLVELDGFDPSSGLILLAATNRPEILDQALLRAGRFDRQVLVDRPDRIGRAQILKVHIRKIKLEPSIDMDKVAALTPGFTGADLANLVNEAALLATRRNANVVTLEDFNAAIERIVAGLEKKNRILSKKERRTVAYHELGHALVAMSLEGVDPVQKVSIIPRGISALGYTLQRPTEDRFLLSEQELRNRMTVLLGGRAAEQLVFNATSTGAADDIEKATEIARDMVTRFGMIPALGQVTYEQSSQNHMQQRWLGNSRQYSEATAEAIDQAIRELIDQAFNQATGILESHRETLENGAKQLLEVEVLSGEALQKLLGQEQQTVQT
ncbi:ATP-dependent zinc metalloprotease FtsH [Marinobacter zhanjiangensis]|uniref:ATP-dependent zinc metalloprotease FtsH n=1 Tax=Marinobacter zhanjiangensis TaxID=578215 RepID=A0ABQ3BAK9_9GAMM|nr:ATP-dependent zinc metalloprotease FtsH [Marinobacter zhanjiangensis]GGY86062.1 ATP-dependent zinc metalloprotease FtsH [Marinobacter zhanjiangensis]